VLLHVSTVLRKIVLLLPTCSEFCGDRAREATLVCLYARTQAGQPHPASSPSSCFTSVFPSWGAERPQAKQITLATLRCLFPRGLRPNFYRNTTAATAEPLGSEVHLFQLSLCIPEQRRDEAPYLSRQAMGSAANPRHMLRAGHPGIQQLIGSLGCGGRDVRRAAAAPPAPVCCRLEKR